MIGVYPNASIVKARRYRGNEFAFLFTSQFAPLGLLMIIIPNTSGSCIGLGKSPVDIEVGNGIDVVEGQIFVAIRWRYSKGLIPHK